MIFHDPDHLGSGSAGEGEEGVALSVALGGEGRVVWAFCTGVLGQSVGDGRDTCHWHEVEMGHRRLAMGSMLGKTNDQCVRPRTRDVHPRCQSMHRHLWPEGRTIERTGMVVRLHQRSRPLFEDDLCPSDEGNVIYGSSVVKIVDRVN